MLGGSPNGTGLLRTIVGTWSYLHTSISQLYFFPIKTTTQSLLTRQRSAVVSLFAAASHSLPSAPVATAARSASITVFSVIWERFWETLVCFSTILTLIRVCSPVGRGCAPRRPFAGRLCSARPAWAVATSRRCLIRSNSTLSTIFDDCRALAVAERPLVRVWRV